MVGQFAGMADCQQKQVLVLSQQLLRCRVMAGPANIVKPGTAGQLLVNFDKQIMQLMREAKAMQRMSIAVPENARMVLLQEEKFKHYLNQLTYVLKVGKLELGLQ